MVYNLFDLYERIISYVLNHCRELLCELALKNISENKKSLDHGKQTKKLNLELVNHQYQELHFLFLQVLNYQQQKLEKMNMMLELIKVL